MHPRMQEKADKGEGEQAGKRDEMADWEMGERKWEKERRQILQTKISQFGFAWLRYFLEAT